jgi:hypothetical protein
VSCWLSKSYSAWIALAALDAVEPVLADVVVADDAGSSPAGRFPDE